MQKDFEISSNLAPCVISTKASYAWEAWYNNIRTSRQYNICMLQMFSVHRKKISGCSSAKANLQISEFTGKLSQHQIENCWHSTSQCGSITTMKHTSNFITTTKIQSNPNPQTLYDIGYFSERNEKILRLSNTWKDWKRKGGDCLT